MTVVATKSITVNLEQQNNTPAAPSITATFPQSVNGGNSIDVSIVITNNDDNQSITGISIQYNATLLLSSGTYTIADGTTTPSINIPPGETKTVYLHIPTPTKDGNGTITVNLDISVKFSGGTTITKDVSHTLTYRGSTTPPAPPAKPSNKKYVWAAVAIGAAAIIAIEARRRHT